MTRRFIAAMLSALAVLSLSRAQSSAAPDALVGPPDVLPAGDPASDAFIGPKLVEPFAVLGQDVASGEKVRLEWNANMGFSGGTIASPVYVMHGVRPGLVLCLSAGVHGDELNGVEIVRRMINEIEPQDLGGTVIAVPVVNLFGFSRNSRYLPDRRDLNRFFPGISHGSIASRIAYSFFHDVIEHCDALVDLHTGSFDRRNLPQVRADLSDPDVRDFSRGFGATTVLHSRGSRGMLRTAAIQAGIPAVTFEVGGPTELELKEIAHSVEALKTLMYKLGMTRHLPMWEEVPPIFYESSWIRADSGGLLASDVVLGDRIEVGQRLGTVIDPINNTVQELLSPITGRVIGIARNQMVLPGFAVFHLGEETSEQDVVKKAQRGNPGIIDEDGPADPDEAESGLD